MALGAQGREVRYLVMMEGATIIATGVLLGLAGAFAGTNLIESFLYGVTPNDPITFAGAALLLSVVALLTSYVPAHKASRTDPMVAIRQ
jgi:ABC-type antimicrobial peptide transport system permease subunit